MAARLAACPAVLHRLRSVTLRPSRHSPGPRGLSSSGAPENEPPFVESVAEFGFVERLVPPSRVPAPPRHEGRAPSGWVPPAASPPAVPYGIRRSRMHNVPVYTDTTNGSRKLTLIRKVQGDIWALDRDVRHFLKELTGKELPTQVNEVTGTLKVKGHFEQELKDWLVGKGF